MDRFAYGLIACYVALMCLLGAAACKPTALPEGAVEVTKECIPVWDSTVPGMSKTLYCKEIATYSKKFFCFRMADQQRTAIPCDFYDGLELTKRIATGVEPIHRPNNLFRFGQRVEVVAEGNIYNYCQGKILEVENRVSRGPIYAISVVACPFRPGTPDDQEFLKITAGEEFLRSVK